MARDGATKSLDHCQAGITTEEGNGGLTVYFGGASLHTGLTIVVQTSSCSLYYASVRIKNQTTDVRCGAESKAAWWLILECNLILWHVRFSFQEMV